MLDETHLGRRCPESRSPRRAGDIFDASGKDGVGLKVGPNEDDPAAGRRGAETETDDGPCQVADARYFDGTANGSLTSMAEGFHSASSAVQ
jgi:hypothetical protein